MTTTMKDVMEFQNEVDEHLKRLDEEASINRILCVGFEAICHSILAVGIRLDYVLSRPSIYK